MLELFRFIGHRNEGLRVADYGIDSPSNTGIVSLLSGDYSLHAYFIRLCLDVKVENLSVVYNELVLVLKGQS